jgi:hypothetical protein
VNFGFVLMLFVRSSYLEFVAGVQEVRPPLVAGLTTPRPLGGVSVFTKIFW